MNPDQVTVEGWSQVDKLRPVSTVEIEDQLALSSSVITFSLSPLSCLVHFDPLWQFGALRGLETFAQLVTKHRQDRPKEVAQARIIIHD